MECTLDDQLLDPRGTKAKAKVEEAEMEQKLKEMENCEYQGCSSNKYDTLKSPGGEWGDDSSCVWGADESWQLGTPASSPKPRCKDSPKGAMHDQVVCDQLMEMIEGGGVEQACDKRGEDS